MRQFRLVAVLGLCIVAAAPIWAGQQDGPPPRQPGTSQPGATQPGQTSPTQPGQPRPGSGRQVQGGPLGPGGFARDQTAPTKGTARLRGVVVSAESGSPIRRATVRATAREFRDTRTILTDADGRFEFQELPAGHYAIEVSKAGFVTMAYGQRYAFEAGRPVELGDGQLLNDISFSLPRGGVITGRILDEYGDALADVVVTASRYQFVRGRTRLTPVGRFAQTNDLGQFRMYGLSPGDYVVTATLRSRQAFDTGAQETTGYAPTYFPGTASPSEAQRVHVALGLEAAADFSLVAARLVRVSGMVVSSSGRPLTGGMVRLQDRDSAGVFRNAANARIDGNGSFTLTGVAPGDYTLIAANGGGGFRGPNATEEAEMARLPVNVGNEDVKSLLVTMAKGAVATGKVVFESGQTTATAGAFRVSATPLDPDDQAGPGAFGGRGGRVNDDWTFELRDIFGRSLVNLTASLGSTWFVKSVTLGGDDITDSGFEPKPGQRVDGLQILLSDRSTTLTGTVTDSRGRPVTDYTVVVFAEDETRWTHPFNRYTSTGRPDQDGRFTITRLPAGTYLAVALDYVDAAAGLDPDLLTGLRDSATRVTLGDAERKSLTLELKRP